ncbi:MAG: aminopeptidase N C-terminal domain-containing protein, partial [Gammaproteobacteria bacterium]|nr:aminopeptidase N C-terminal domain-containing protein [Gammaproteobacteria bacterium]
MQFNTLDTDLRAELLTPPGFEEVAATLKLIDVSRVEAVRDYFRQQLGLSLYDTALELYNQLWQEEDHQMNGQSYGRRKLRNVCLWLIMKANEDANRELCKVQFAAAKTMTDQIASFALLVNSAHQESRSKAIDDFYSQWSKDDLVMDKWFSLQAASELPDALTHVKDLLKHSAFSIKNPNKVRSVIGAFCMANPRNFHAIDGSGYAFLSEMLMTLDKLNPQIAARLATPFTRWQRYDQSRQDLMKQQLEQLAKQELSD